MVCKECGKEIPEGALYCESCGAPLEEPIVLKVSKEDIKRAEKEEKAKAKERAKLAAKNTVKQVPEKKHHRKAADTSKAIDIVGYFQSIGGDMNLLLAFVGSILLYLAPFMNWIWEKLFDVKRKANLFEIGMKSSMVEEDGSILAMGETIVLVLGIIAILVGVWMLLLSACDYIKWLRKYAANPIMRFAPILVMLVIFIIVINNKHYTQSLRVLEDNVRLAKELGTSSNYDAGRGLGPVFYVVGLVIYTLGTVGDTSRQQGKRGLRFSKTAKEREGDAVEGRGAWPQPANYPCIVATRTATQMATSPATMSQLAGLPRLSVQPIPKRLGTTTAGSSRLA